MHGTVQIRDLFNFFLCCCLSKGTIFHRFLMFVLFTSFYHSGYFGVACVIYLRDCEAQHCSPKPWLGIAIRQVNYNQPPQVKISTTRRRERVRSLQVKSQRAEAAHSTMRAWYPWNLDVHFLAAASKTMTASEMRSALSIQTEKNCEGKWIVKHNRREMFFK